MFQSSIMFWNQCTYEWYNSPTKYIWFTEPYNIFTIPTKGLRSITFNNNLSMKFYTNKKETIKKNLSHQSLRSWYLNQMI
jgi:hypothetical protein